VLLLGVFIAKHDPVSVENCIVLHSVQHISLNEFKNVALVLFLAYFTKMKVGLSNHQSVCVCVPTNNV
jgi:hypothetical protein